MAASDLNVAFAKSITRCLSTVSCAVPRYCFRHESTSMLCLLSGRRETSTTDGCLHESAIAHSTGVSLDEAVMCLRCIPRQLPIHPTANTAIQPVARRQSCLS